MRKTIVTLILFNLLFMVAESQTVGLKIGPVFSKIDWYNSLATDNTVFEKGYIGFMTVAEINYFHRKIFDVSSSVGYIKTGGKGTVLTIDYNHPNFTKTIDTETLLNFLTINTLGSLNFKMSEKVIPFVGFGPNISYLLSYKENTGLFSQLERDDKLNRLLYGAVFIGGINFSFNKFQIGVESQYTQLLNKPVNYTSQANVTNTIDVKWFPVLVSVKYQIRK